MSKTKTPEEILKETIPGWERLNVPVTQIIKSIETYAAQFLEAEGMRGYDQSIEFLKIVVNNIIRWGDDTVDDFTQSVYFSHAGDINTAIELLERYKEYLPVAASPKEGEMKPVK